MTPLKARSKLRWSDLKEATTLARSCQGRTANATRMKSRIGGAISCGGGTVNVPRGKTISRPTPRYTAKRTAQVWKQTAPIHAHPLDDGVMICRRGKQMVLTQTPGIQSRKKYKHQPKLCPGGWTLTAWCMFVRLFCSAACSSDRTLFVFKKKGNKTKTLNLQRLRTVRTSVRLDYDAVHGTARHDPIYPGRHLRGKQITVPYSQGKEE